MSNANLVALRAFRDEAKQLYEFSNRLLGQEEADASEVAELDIMLADCIDALSTLEDTVTDNDEETEA